MDVPPSQVDVSEWEVNTSISENSEPTQSREIVKQSDEDRLFDSPVKDYSETKTSEGPKKEPPNGGCNLLIVLFSNGRSLFIENV